MYAEESQAYCSGQCRASRYPPDTCRCPCRGRNHGILLRFSRQPINVTPQYQEPYREYLPEERMRLIARDLDALPDLSQNREPFFENRTSIPAGSQTPLIAKKGKYRIAKAIGRSFKHAVAGYSEEELNQHIVKGLRVQLNEENTDLAIDQAYSVFYSHNPQANRPELYELYENGDIDRALELMGKRWVIGRPKR